MKLVALPRTVEFVKKQQCSAEKHCCATLAGGGGPPSKVVENAAQGELAFKVSFENFWPVLQFSSLKLMAAVVAQK